MQQSSLKTSPKNRIGIPNFIKTAYINAERIVCIKAGRRCFVGDTLVKTDKGYRHISDIKKGDNVLSYNHTSNSGEYREVLETHTFAGRQKTKPIVQLEYAKGYIESTYDHPYYTENQLGEKGYFPAFVIAWRNLDADSRNRIKVFCKQHGQDIDHELQMYWGGSNNEASPRREWLLQDDGSEGRPILNNKTTPRDSQGVYTEPTQQASYKSQKLHKNGQSSGESRVGDISRERSTCSEAGQAVDKLGREVWHSQDKREPGEADTVTTIRQHSAEAKRTGGDLWSGRVDNTRHTNGENVVLSTIGGWGVLSARVAEPKTTYDLTVDGDHNYTVTKDNILVHNTGKTYNFALWLIQQADNNPNSPCLWVDTKQANIDKYVERYFKFLLTKMGLWEQCDWSAQKKILKMHNGSYIDFGSAERPEMLEGFGYKYAVLNEAGIILKKKSLWDNTLYPMIKHAKVRIIGTPKGGNTFETLYRQYPHYTFTAYDSPYWTAEEIEQAKLTMTEQAFKQEMLAEFIEGAGAVFRNIYDNIAGELLSEPVAGRRYTLSADLAKHTDFTVILIGDIESKQVVYHERFNQIDWGLQKSRIIAAYKRFNCVSGIVDATGVGDSVFDDLRNAGLNVEGFKFTSTTKQELVSNLSIAMDNHDISYPNIETLTDELALYAYEQRANGQFSYSAPEGFHDDEVMSLALLNRIINTKPLMYAMAR